LFGGAKTYPVTRSGAHGVRELLRRRFSAAPDWAL